MCEKFAIYWDEVVQEYKSKAEEAVKSRKPDIEAEELENEPIIALMLKIQNIPQRVRDYLCKKFLENVYRLCWM